MPIYIRPANQHCCDKEGSGSDSNGIASCPNSTAHFKLWLQIKSCSEFDLGRKSHRCQSVVGAHSHTASSLFIFCTALCSISKWGLGRKLDRGEKIWGAVEMKALRTSCVMWQQTSQLATLAALKATNEADVEYLMNIYMHKWWKGTQKQTSRFVL